jgi:hypothetical protein
MAEFTIRIEYESGVEADEQALRSLVGFTLMRVQLECERRDFPFWGELIVQRRKIDTSGQFRAQPVDLTFVVEDATRERWRSAMVTMRRGLGLPEPEVLEA